MTVNFPYFFNNLKPQDKKLIYSIANGVYPGKEVHASEWPDFLSNFNVLTNVTNFSITAVDSETVKSPFANLKPVAVSISFKCDNKISSYIREYIEMENPDDKFIGVMKPISVGFSNSSYTSFFITDIKLEDSKVYTADNIFFTRDKIYYSIYSVTIIGYTFYKTTQTENIEFYED